MRYEVVGKAFKRFHDGREVCLDNKAGRAEYAWRTEVMRIRQENVCARGSHKIVYPTFDHGKSRGLGGAFRDDRIEDASGKLMNGCSCFSCNGKAGSKPLGNEASVR